MKIVSLVCFLVMINGAVFSQSGYYGSVDGFEFCFTAAPSLARVSSIVEIDDEEFVRSHRKIATVGFNLSYNRVLTRNLEFGISYGYSRIKTDLRGIRYDPPGSGTYDFMKDLVGNKHQIGLKLNIYRKSLLAPMGTYFTIETALGKANFVSDSLNVGKYSSSSVNSNFMNRYYTIDYNFGEPINITDRKANYFAIRLGAGRNIPITKKILIKAAVSIPIVSFQFGNGFNTSKGYTYLRSKVVYEVEGGDVTPILYKTIYKSHMIVGEVGLRYQL